MSLSRTVQHAAKMIDECASRCEVRKAPAVIDSVSFKNYAPVSRVNVSCFVKIDNPATQFDTQPVTRNRKLDNVGVFGFIHERLSVG
jgi:hypothetical protein